MCARYLIAAAAAILAVAPVMAGETIKYSYDAVDRLTTVTHSGGASDGAVTTYTLDNTGNRIKVSTAGSFLDQASQPVLVVPLSGGRPIVLPNP